VIYFSLVWKTNQNLFLKINKLLPCEEARTFLIEPEDGAGDDAGGVAMKDVERLRCHRPQPRAGARVWYRDFGPGECSACSSRFLAYVLASNLDSLCKMTGTTNRGEFEDHQLALTLISMFTGPFKLETSCWTQQPCEGGWSQRARSHVCGGARCPGPHVAGSGPDAGLQLGARVAHEVRDVEHLRRGKGRKQREPRSPPQQLVIMRNNPQ